MGLNNRSDINRAHAYETIQYVKTLGLQLTSMQDLALHYLIRDIGIDNFDRSTLKKVLLDKNSSLNRIRGAWLALKRIDGIVSKEALSRRFEEIALWQKT